MTAKRNRMRELVKSWFTAQAEHITVEFIPDGTPPTPGDGYLRLWLVEGFLAQRVSWTREHFPVLHGGVTLQFLGGEATPFTRFTRTGGELTTPGAFLNYPMTPLVPFAGGTVEVEAALYRASDGGPLDTAVAIAGNLASLVGPPLSTAAAVAEKVSDGIATVVAGQAESPVLGVHWGMSAADGGPQVAPGYLAVVNGHPRDYAGKLRIVDDRLHGEDGQLTGVDFLVLRVECLLERDDWAFPELERLRVAAQKALVFGETEAYEYHLKLAVTTALECPDLSRIDALRVAKKVRESIDAAKELGFAAPADELSLDPIAPHTLPGRHEVAGLTAADLLA
ncbi:hypothetical protein [Actinokineospora sp. NPDC004072]